MTTNSISNITQTTATCGGDAIADGGSTVTTRGVCWSTGVAPTIANDTTIDGSGTGSFSSTIIGLSAETLYYVRAYATNSAGTAYGESRSFTTGEPTTMTDIDGNVYQTVTIGTQVWMAENLKVTHYRDGDTIPNVINNSTWEYLSSGGYCDYDNNPVNVAIYGRLYNWYAVSDARNIAPEGWHVPTVTEWQTLIDFLGGEAIAGGEMKEAGTTHWVVSAPDITNESGFTALPAGARLTDGNFVDMGSSTEFWSCTAYDDDYAYFRSLTTYGTSILGGYNNKPLGYSIRCVKD